MRNRMVLLAASLVVSVVGCNGGGISSPSVTQKPDTVVVKKPDSVTTPVVVPVIDTTAARALAWANLAIVTDDDSLGYTGTFRAAIDTAKVSITTAGVGCEWNANTRTLRVPAFYVGRRAYSIASLLAHEFGHLRKSHDAFWDASVGGFTKDSTWGGGAWTMQYRYNCVLLRNMSVLGLTANDTSDIAGTNREIQHNWILVGAPSKCNK